MKFECVLILLFSCISFLCSGCHEDSGPLQRAASKEKKVVRRPVGRSKVSKRVAKKKVVALATVEGKSLDYRSFRQWSGLTDTPRAALGREKLDKKGKARFLGYVRYRLLLSAAKKAGLAEHAKVRRAREQAMVRIYVEEHLKKKLSSLTPSKQELASFYHKNKKQFQRPELRRTSLFFLACQGKYKERTACRSRFDALSAGLSVAKFRSLAKKHSDHTSRFRGGDLGFVYPPGQTQTRGVRLAPEIRRTIFSSKVGALSSTISTKRGFAIVHVVGVLPSRQFSLKRQRGRVTMLWKRAQRKARRKAFFQQLATSFGLKLHGELAKVKEQL